MEIYLVKIVRHDDYHATVTRKSDGAQLIFINQWRWRIERKTRPKALNRAFARYDKRKKKLEEVDEFTR